MEMTTCEQYVLAELEAAQNANERLAQENERLQAQVEILEAKANEEPTRIQRYIVAYGRKKLFGELTYAESTPVKSSDGKDMPFKRWCEAAMRDYGRPKWMSISEFIAEFEPEFREAYDERRVDEEEE